MCPVDVKKVPSANRDVTCENSAFSLKGNITARTEVGVGGPLGVFGIRGESIVRNIVQLNAA